MLTCAKTDTQEYGFYGLTNTSTVWGVNTNLPAPALNISAHYLDNIAFKQNGPKSVLYGNDWKIPGTDEQPFRNKASMSWTAGNGTYDIAYLRNNGACQPIVGVS